MICDFCGAPNAAPMSIPYFIYKDVTDEQMENPAIAMSAWGHPLTGNVCRKCLLGELIKASNKQLVAVKNVANELELAAFGYPCPDLGCELIGGECNRKDRVERECWEKWLRAKCAK